MKKFAQRFSWISTDKYLKKYVEIHENVFTKIHLKIEKKWQKSMRQKKYNK